MELRPVVDIAETESSKVSTNLSGVLEAIGIFSAKAPISENTK